MYYIYHIPGKKVGISTNPQKRLWDQGYKMSEVDIIGHEDNCINALRLERTERIKFNYKSDGFFHPHILNMEYKTYEGNTVGFPIDKADFNSWLDDHTNGLTISTMKSTYHIKKTDTAFQWLKDNAKKSKFANGNLKTFIYCKAFDEAWTQKEEDCKTLDEYIKCIHDWTDDRGILKGNITTQTLKLGEEFGELQHAVLKDKPEEIKDAIGDLIVVLVSIAHFNGHSVLEAVKMAYDTISKRTGYTNAKGDFIKTKYDGKEITGTL